MRDEDNAPSKENLHVQVDYRISGRQVNYAIFTIVLSALGYSGYSSSDNDEETGGISHQHYIEIKHEVDEIKQSLALVKREVAMVETMTSDHINGGKK